MMKGMQYYLLVVPGRLQREPWYWVVERKLVLTSCPRDTIAVVKEGTDASLWHHRLGHMSEKWMKMLLSKVKLPELKSINFDMCASCILGKQKMVSFLKTGKTPKAGRLELVHTDLWRPSLVASLGGSMYYITFIDDLSRKVWVYFLKNKSDIFETFKKWKAMVETNRFRSKMSEIKQWRRVHRWRIQ